MITAAEHTRLLALLDCLYEAALEPDAWFRFLAALAQACSASRVELLLRSPAGGEIELAASFGMPRGAACHYPALFRRRAGGREESHGAILELGAECGLGADPPSCCVVVSEVPAGSSQHDGLLVLWAEGRGARGLGAEARRTLELVVPHVGRTLALHTRILHSRALADMAEATVDLLPFGFIVIEDDGYVLFMNETAKRVVGSGQGPRIADGKVVDLGGAIAELRAAEPEHGDAPAGRFLQLSHGSDGRARHGFVVPLLETARGTSTSRFKPRKLILFLDETVNESRISAQALRDLFGLTPAEARLLCHLMAGRTVAEICSRLGITQNTAKSHLRSLRGKTDSGSQVELVRLALMSPATLQTAEPSHH